MFSVGVSAAALMVLTRTFSISQRTLSTSQELLSLEKRSSSVQLRAWVLPTEISIPQVPDLSDTPPSHVGFVMKNYGSSPAANCIVEASISAKDLNRVETPVYKLGLFHSVYLPPGESFPINLRIPDGVHSTVPNKLRLDLLWTYVDLSRSSEDPIVERIVITMDWMDNFFPRYQIEQPS